MFVRPPRSMIERLVGRAHRVDLRDREAGAGRAGRREVGEDPARGARRRPSGPPRRSRRRPGPGRCSPVAATGATRVGERGELVGQRREHERREGVEDQVEDLRRHERRARLAASSSSAGHGVDGDVVAGADRAVRSGAERPVDRAAGAAGPRSIRRRRGDAGRRAGCRRRRTRRPGPSPGRSAGRASPTSQTTATPYHHGYRRRWAARVAALLIGPPRARGASRPARPARRAGWCPTAGRSRRRVG